MISGMRLLMSTSACCISMANNSAAMEFSIYRPEPFLPCLQWEVGSRPRGCKCTSADETLERLWEGSWADDALVEDRDKDIYADYQKIRTIHHKGEHFTVEAPHILDPSPQRTPFIFQAGTSP